MLKPTNTPAQTTEAPARPTKAPAQPTNTPAQVNKAPAQTTKAPAQTTEAPSKVNVPQPDSPQTTSFHTHTYLCKHATGTVADYCKQAEKEGCTALGFSDHVPYPDDGEDTWASVRMTKDQAPDYIAQIRKIAPTLPFPVYAGFECEYDSQYLSWYKDFLFSKLKCDYLVLGQHWVKDGSKRLFIAKYGKDTNLLHKWTDQTIEGINSGLFSFLAHPDLLMLGLDTFTDDLKSCFSAILDAAENCHLPIEVNGYGIIKPKVSNPDGSLRFPYPYDKFWELVVTRNVKIICNSDAHDPDKVLKNARGAREYATRFGINPITEIEAPYGSETMQKLHQR